MGYARLVRGQVLKMRELEYVQAARALGAPTSRVLVRHVIPATFSAVTVQATLGMAGAIIAEASLSFLGLGVQPPTPSWGTMLDAGRSHLFDAPHLTLVPGLAIALLVLGFNFARRRAARSPRSARYLIGVATAAATGRSSRSSSIALSAAPAFAPSASPLCQRARATSPSVPASADAP